MANIRFRAYAVANEIDLNQIAQSFGIPKKYTWEEPLILRAATLRQAILHEAPEGSEVFLFSFGVAVFVNTPEPEEKGVFAFLKRMGYKTDGADFGRFTDDYELRIGPVAEGEESFQLTDKFIQIEDARPYQVTMIATIIAKSVALEKTEERLTEIMDSLEPMIERLEAGKLRVSDKQLAKVSSRIARYEYTTLAYIMILDKPDITWASSEAQELYDAMSDFFELSDRYEILKQKTELLNSIVENIGSTSRTVKSVVIEWVVVILIAIEVVIMLYELFQ